eukprot:7691164-Ditylum_brightwellii.AAC.1
MNEKKTHCNETNKQSKRDNIEEDDEQPLSREEKSGTGTSLAKNEGYTVLPSSRNDGRMQYTREVKNCNKTWNDLTSGDRKGVENEKEKKERMNIVDNYKSDCNTQPEFVFVMKECVSDVKKKQAGKRYNRRRGEVTQKAPKEERRQGKQLKQRKKGWQHQVKKMMPSFLIMASSSHHSSMLVHKTH